MNASFECEYCGEGMPEGPPVLNHEACAAELSRAIEALNERGRAAYRARQLAELREQQELDAACGSIAAWYGIRRALGAGS